ncbi:hypothetical protein GW17_00024362 [Ensete ventricosum]|nr:hypothetical protein GW17_00024362 [Ensete ventricosum]
MCESGRAVWAPRRGYSPGIRVPQSHVTCGLSAITISSVRSCASIRGGAADAHTTAVDRNLFHKLVVGFMVAATILAAVMTRMDCRGGLTSLKMSSMDDLTIKQQPDISWTEERFERSTAKDRRMGERSWRTNSSIRAVFTSTNLISGNNQGRGEMYTTRPLSVFKNSAGAAAIPPPPPTGPNSGYLLLQDEGAEPNPSCCWGLCEDTRVRELPFPQNRILTITYTEHNGQSSCTYRFPALFIPVLYKLLSSNHYYVIVAKGKKKGKAYTCSLEEDMTACCFGRCVNDVKPREFDHRDIYQQVEIVCKGGRFTARSVAPDGFAPWPLRRKNWRLYASKPKDYDLTDAWGLDKALRDRTPALELPISGAGGASLVVGRWYAPCVFVKEGDSLRRQMERSAFYEITLEQHWEQVFACENLYGDRRTVEVKATVRAEGAVLGGVEAARDGAGGLDGVVWFKPLDSAGERVGLSSPVWERMRWEQGRGGWIGGDGKVERLEEYGGVSPWKRFGCYVLVERFVVRRTDASTALIVDFKHTGKIQTKWE